jgi:Tol biopolymer transport system component
MGRAKTFARGSAVAAVVLAAAGLSTPAGAVVPGANGPIVFESRRDGNSEIYTMGIDGSAPTRLTANPAMDFLPAWSPDGSKIAFTSNRGGNFDIWVMNANGSSPVNLTAGSPGNDRYPAWSPDGSKISFMSTRDRNGNFEIYVMGADGSAPRRLTNTPDIEECCQDWKPDGSAIVFQTKRDGDFELYVVNPDGTGLRNLTQNHPPGGWPDWAGYDGTPGWSPDGRRIVFRSLRNQANDLYVMDVAAAPAATRITFNGGGNRTPAYTPDGTKIVYVSSRNGDNDVWIMNANGSAQVNLSRSPGGDYNPDVRRL